MDPLTCPDFYTLDVHQWLLLNLKNNILGYNNWPLLFGSAVHSLWWIRNEELFDLATASTAEIYDRFSVVFQAQQVDNALSHSCIPSISWSLTLVCWKSPHEGFVKLNCDDYILSTLASACGGLIRDSLGCFCGGFVSNLSSCPIIVAEVWAIYYSLQLAWQKGFRHILLESNSSSALSYLFRT